MIEAYEPKTMKIGYFTVCMFLACWTQSLAQDLESSPENQVLLDEQAADIFRALVPSVKSASAGTVEVRVWRKRVSYGTIVGPETVLTKWSEVSRDLRSLSCRTGAGEWLPAVVSGVYPDADLAVIKVAGLEVDPVVFAGEKDLRPGSFLCLTRPDGEAAGMGVVSVMPRSLRSSDRAFLGVAMDLEFKGPGVLVRRVELGTGAERSGLMASDIILEVTGKKVNGSFELSTLLQRLDPGQKVKIRFARGEEEREIEVELGGRPRAPRIPYSRMEQMNNMGGHRYSEVRDGFSSVVQSDMQIAPEDCGAPVVDLEGRVVGLAIARAGRIKTFIIPSSAIKKLLASKPAPPEVQLGDAGKMSPPEVRTPEADPFEAMRRRLEEMKRLMEEIEEGDE
tara:strand:- start:1275 stop:2456 length:1182 start_codon:yes stop_codon:yes gene_type:complete